MEELLSFEALGTISGAAFLTYLIVAYTWRLVDASWRWGRDLYAAIIGFLILLVASFGLGAAATDWRVYILALANGFVVALASGKLYDKAVAESTRTEDK